MADQSLQKFLFDVPGWRSSKAIHRMTMSERGVYLEMLLEQWEKRNLPDDPQAVAEAIAVTDAQAAEVLAAWPVVRRKFLPSRGDESRIYNATMERTRREQREYRRKRQDAGAAGGRAKAAKRGKDTELLAGTATAVLSTSVAMLSEKVSKGEVREGKGSEVKVEQVKVGVVPPLAGKEPPLQLHLRRLKVWRYMVERWTERLGDHADAFDIHGWLADLDGQVGSVVLPSSGNEWWAFLDARFTAEVRKRGLPVASVEPAGPTNKRIVGLMAGGEAFLKRVAEQRARESA